MADKGGPTTQAGIDYQNKIATLFLGRMIDPGPWPKSEEIIEVRNEDPTADVDDVVIRCQDDHTVWIQVKWNMEKSGKTWIKFWQHMITQRWGKFGDRDRLVLVMGQSPNWVKDLKEICGKAYGASNLIELVSLGDQTKEWQMRLSETQKKLVDDIAEKILGEHIASKNSVQASRTDWINESRKQ